MSPGPGSPPGVWVKTAKKHGLFSGLFCLSDIKVPLEGPGSPSGSLFHVFGPISENLDFSGPKHVKNSIKVGEKGSKLENLA